MTDFRSQFDFNHKRYSYFNLSDAVSPYGGDVHKLPYIIRILLESLVRKYDGVDVSKSQIKNLAIYQAAAPQGVVPFKLSRVILQDFTGVPVVVDLVISHSV